MPCSLLLALCLLPTPDYSISQCLVIDLTHQFSQEYEEVVTIIQKHQVRGKLPTSKESIPPAPAVAEKSALIETVTDPYEELIAYIQQHQVSCEESSSNGLPQPIPTVADQPNSPEVVAPTVVSEPTPACNPAIAERAPRQELVIPSEPQIAKTPAIVDSHSTPATVISPMDLSTLKWEPASVTECPPAIAERPVRIVKDESRPEEWQQVAQAWPTLPPHVRIEILRLIENVQ